MNFFRKKPSQTTPFKFRESASTACFVCDHVMYKKRPILYATHEADDGAWQFLCGFKDHTNSNIKIISLKNATEIDPSINDLYDMPPGIGAERKSVHHKWTPFKIKG
jgi:hypothetical protein